METPRETKKTFEASDTNSNGPPLNAYTRYDTRGEPPVADQRMVNSGQVDGTFASVLVIGFFTDVAEDVGVENAAVRRRSRRRMGRR